jgi:hypothetical protein
MAEYSRLAKGKFTSTGFAQPITLPFQPDFVEMINYSVANAAPSANAVFKASWDSNMGQGFAVEETYNATPVLVADTVTTNGISTFSAGLSFQFGPINQHNGSPVSEFSMTAASPVVVTTVGNHGLQTGDVVIFSNLYQTSTTGMQQMAGIPFMITRTGATTFSVNWNAAGSNYTAFNTATSTGNIGSFKKLLYPNLYFPGDQIISAVTTGTTTTITTTMQNNFVVGQEVGFRIPTVWGPSQLNELPDVLIPGSPIYGYIVSLTNSTTFVVNIDSTGYTAFNPNQPFANFRGLSYPQVGAVGDVNTGGVQISAGSPLYPPPQYSYASLNDSSTINGPAIQGAFVNNTSQGFIIGTGAGTNLTGSVLVGATGNVIYWRAFLHDYSRP